MQTLSMMNLLERITRTEIRAFEQAV